MPTLSLKELAALAGGTLLGDPAVKINGVASLESASAGDLVFVLESKNLTTALSSPASALVAQESLKEKIRQKPAILVKNPRLAMVKILSLFAPGKKAKSGIHKTAAVARSAKIGRRVTIHPFVFIGENCEIGDDTTIHPSVTIYDRVKIGKRVVIHSGARLGVDGYGFVWDDSEFKKIPQIGRLIIEDDVEIFANVCISRGALGTTRIGAGTKIDNLTHIAHNCDIGKNCAITALVGFAGSVTFKDHVQVGGMAGFSGHITVGENTVVMAKSGVTKDVPPHSVVSGFPAQDHIEELKYQAALKRIAKKAG